MPNFAERQLAKVFKGRGIAGQKGFRTHSATGIIEYADPTTGQGGIVRESLPFLEGNGQNPRIEWEKSDDVAFGNAPSNIVKVGPMTPSAALDDFFTRALDEGESRFVVIAGPNCPDSEKFAILDYDAGRPLRRMVRVQGLEQALQGFTG
jgi:hypothetical protein